MTQADTILVGQLRQWSPRWDETIDDPLVFIVLGFETSGGREYATVLFEDRVQTHRLSHVLAFSEAC